MNKGSEYSPKDEMPSKVGEAEDNKEIETIYVGEPGVDQQLVAEAQTSRRQLEVERLKTTNIAETTERLRQKVEQDAKPGDEVVAEEKDEIRVLTNILHRLAEKGSGDEIMSVKDAPGADLEGEKFTITKENESEVKEELTKRGYRFEKIAKTLPDLGFKAIKGKIEMVFFFSKEKK